MGSMERWWTRCSTGAGLQALHPPYGAPIPQWAKGSGPGVLAVRAAQCLLLVPLHLHRTRHEAEFALQLAGGFPQHRLRVGAGVWGWQGPTISPTAPSPAPGAVRASAGHSPTATCTDTTGWLSVSAQMCRSWVPLTPLTASSTSFTASNSMPRGAPASGASQGGAGPSPIPHLGSGFLGPGGQLGVGTPPVWDQAAAQCLWGEAAAPHVAEKGLGGLRGARNAGGGLGREQRLLWGGLLCAP